MRVSFRKHRLTKATSCISTNAIGISDVINVFLWWQKGHPLKTRIIGSFVDFFFNSVFQSIVVAPPSISKISNNSSFITTFITLLLNNLKYSCFITIVTYQLNWRSFFLVNLNNRCNHWQSRQGKPDPAAYLCSKCHCPL